MTRNPYLSPKQLSGITNPKNSMYWLGKNLKLWGSIIMQNESFWSFPILLEYYIIQETIFPHLINLLLKAFGEISSKTFPADTTSKILFLTSATAVGIQQMSKIQCRLVVKPKIIKLLTACKNHSTNLLNLSNHLWDTAESHDLKGLAHFWAYPPNNY